MTLLSQTRMAEKSLCSTSSGFQNVRNPEEKRTCIYLAPTSAVKWFYKF